MSFSYKEPSKRSTNNICMTASKSLLAANSPEVSTVFFVLSSFNSANVLPVLKPYKWIGTNFSISKCLDKVSDNSLDFCDIAVSFSSSPCSSRMPVFVSANCSELTGRDCVLGSTASGSVT